MTETGKIVLVERKFSIYSQFLDTILQSEGVIREGESREDALMRVHDELEETANKLRKRLNPQEPTYTVAGRPPIIDYGKHDASPEGVLADIKRCETLEELLTFKRIASADQTEGKELYTAYCQKLKELTPNTFTEGIS